MSPTVAQTFDTEVRYYPQTEKREVAKPEQNFEEISIDKEQILHDIEIWSAYLHNLKSGNPVENPSPSGDRWFLIPENIEIIIEGLESGLDGGFRTVNPKNRCIL